MKSASFFHGSAKSFDNFSLEKSMTGAGINRFGKGIYLTSNIHLAEHYRNSMPKNDMDEVVIGIGDYGDLVTYTSEDPYFSNAKELIQLGLSDIKSKSLIENWDHEDEDDLGRTSFDMMTDFTGFDLRLEKGAVYETHLLSHANIAIGSDPIDDQFIMDTLHNINPEGLEKAEDIALQAHEGFEFEEDFRRLIVSGFTELEGFDFIDESLSSAMKLLPECSLFDLSQTDKADYLEYIRSCLDDDPDRFLALMNKLSIDGIYIDQNVSVLSGSDKGREDNLVIFNPDAISKPEIIFSSDYIQADNEYLMDQEMTI